MSYKEVSWIKTNLIDDLVHAKRFYFFIFSHDQAVQPDGVASRKKVLWRCRGDPEAEMKIDLLLWSDPICCAEVRDLL
jgi:hypothetical protein